jgi:hypothetical protein
VNLIADFSDQAVTQIEIDTIVEAEKAMKGLKSNAFVVFDYVSDGDYKFAGVDVSRNKVQIGYRVGDDWIIVAEVNANLKPDTPYDLNVLIIGNTITISVDGVEMASYVFDESLLDGQVGVATNSGEATFTQTTVTAQGDDSVSYTSTEDEQAADTTGGSDAGSIDWGDTTIEDGPSSDATMPDAGDDTDSTASETETINDDGSTDPVGTSSSGSATDDEQVTVSAWVPRSDFDTAA